MKEQNTVAAASSITRNENRLGLLFLTRFLRELFRRLTAGEVTLAVACLSSGDFGEASVASGEAFCGCRLIPETRRNRLLRMGARVGGGVIFA